MAAICRCQEANAIVSATNVQDMIRTFGAGRATSENRLIRTEKIDPMKKEISEEALSDLCQALENEGIAIWIDGGWAVDALLGKQTRPHSDADLVVEDKDLDRLVTFLHERGY